jgi:predicted HTH transcriptional regulator
MTEQELKKYLQTEFPQENEACEWKEYKSLKHSFSGTSGNDIISYVSALANMEGGSLVIGIEDNTHNIIGIQDFNNHTAQNIRLRILSKCPNLDSEHFTIEDIETSDSKKKVWIFHIPKHLARRPVSAHERYWQRVDDSLVELRKERLEAILKEPIFTNDDWSAQIVQNATLDDLEPKAIEKARKEYKEKNPRKAIECDTWDDITFLNKAKITLQGKITNTALLLLGKEEASHFLSPAVAKISWILKDENNVELDYEHFGIPFLLSSSEVFSRIRNLTYRYIKDNSLFPTEIKMYDAFVIREALHNCIAHQDYNLQGRITVVEKPDELLFSNLGEFIPKSIERVIEQDAPQEYYRNQFLADAMVNLNMIDTIGTTNFTAIGASVGSGAGSMFVATGVGSGTGSAYRVASAMVKRQVIESEYNQLDLESSSLTSVTVATGSKSLTTEKNKAYKVNDALIITSRVNPLNYMVGTVTSYSNTTGVLVANISSVVGSGTFADWIIHGESTNVVNYSGRLILANVIGTFDNTGYIRVGIINVALPNGDTSTPVSQISILPGGNYQFVQNNFLASADTKKIYGTDSLNRAFEFDGDVYIPIRTQITIDAPTQIAVVNNTGDTQLVLSYFGQVLFSAIGSPHDFRTTSLGFQDLGFGDTITGMSSQVGGVLAVFCRDSVHQAVIDSGTGLWISKLISPELGAIHYGVLNLGGLYAFDDKGIVKIVPSYVFGGFEHDTVSRAIQPVIDKFREKIVATAAFKSKNQCRFYASDGSGICMTMAQGANGIEHHFTQFQYPISVSYAWHGEDASGRDIVLIGDESGFVYVANKGSSFDGQEITAYIRTAFNNLKSPSAIKRFRKMEVEVSTVGYSEIRFNPDFSYADPDVATHIFRNETINGVGGYWDEALFSTFYYDGKIISQPEMRLFGSGTNIGLVIFSKSAIDFGHTLSGVILHYTPRKLNR